MNTTARSALLCVMAATGDGAAADILQPQTVEASVPGIGTVEASIKIAPGQRPTVVFRSDHNDTLLAFELGDAGPPDPDSAMQPKGQTLIRSFEEIPSPVFATHVRTYYATGYKDHLALVAAIRGRLMLLHQPWEADDLGGIHVGRLSQAVPLGVAAWNFEWADCHLCPNPYVIRICPWNAAKTKFDEEAGTVERTEKRYKDPDQAIHERHPGYANFIAEFPKLDEF